MLLAHRSGTPFRSDAGLREFSYGVFEAKPEEALYSRVGVVPMYSQVFEGTFRGLPEGETGAGFLSRVARSFLAIEHAHAVAGGPALVVSHGVSLMAYLAMIEQIPPRPLANASVTVVEVDGRRQGHRRRRVRPVWLRRHATAGHPDGCAERARARGHRGS